MLPKKIDTQNIQQHIFQVELTPGEYLPIPMVFVAGGTFEMGGESDYEDSLPIHSVQLDDFYIGQYLVTQELWQAVMGDNPSRYQGKTRPVENVSWNDCNVFIEKLNQLPICDLGGKPFGGGAFRLPTEAEWEYAARGGKHWTDRYEYAGSNDLAQVAWYHGNSFGHTMPVGLKMPNQLGIYDMSGNVGEWCEDHGKANFYAQCAVQGIVQNPVCRAENNPPCVSRGAGSLGEVKYGRVWTRHSYHLDTLSYGLGFRLGFSKNLANPG